MERFNLSLWLQDKNRRIVTGDGREVRIVCWDADGIKPIIALVKNKFANGNTIVQYTKYGTVLPDEYTDNDLFFAKEEKELRTKQMNRYLECLEMLEDMRIMIQD